MLLLPTSGTSAIVLEIPWQAQLAFQLAAGALAFGGAFVLWEMVLSLVLGRRPAASRQWWLFATIASAGAGILLGTISTPDATFNGEVFTTWGFALAGWFNMAALVCAAVLLVLRFIDARRADALGSVPAAVAWAVGCAITMGVGVFFAWESWVGISFSAGMNAATACMFALGVCALGSVLSAAVIQARRATAAGN